MCNGQSSKVYFTSGTKNTKKRKKAEAKFNINKKPMKKKYLKKFNDQILMIISNTIYNIAKCLFKLKLIQISWETYFVFKTCKTGLLNLTHFHPNLILKLRMNRYVQF